MSDNGLSSQQQASIEALQQAIEALQQLPAPTDTDEELRVFSSEVQSLCAEMAAIQRQISGLYEPGMTGFIP